MSIETNSDVPIVTSINMVSWLILIRVKKYYPKALFSERDLITVRPVKKLVTVITGSRSKSCVMFTLK